MSKIIKFLHRIKTKLAAGTVTAALVVAPGGVALAHNRDNGNNDRQRNFNQADNNDRGRNDRNNWNGWDDKKKRKPEQQLSCDERQAKVTQIVTDYKNKSQERFNGLSLYLASQQSFVSSNNITLPKYDSLNQRATDAQNKTTNTLAATVVPELNCDEQEQKNDAGVIFQAIEELRLIRITPKP